MAKIKLPFALEKNGTTPVTTADDIDITIDGQVKNLGDVVREGTGGGGLPADVTAYDIPYDDPDDDFSIGDAVDAKLKKPTTTGNAGDVLTLGEDGITPVWKAENVVAENVGFDNDNTGLESDNAQDALAEVAGICNNKQNKRSILTPTYDEDLSAYVLTIETNSESGVVDWRENESALYVVVDKCPNEIIIYFDGDTEFYDDASFRLGDTVEIESGKTYIASYLDGIVAVAEVQEIE